MTERSYIWDGTTVGDAALNIGAPYNAAEFNKYFSLPVAFGNEDVGYVVPGYLEDLSVESGGVGTRSVIIRPGAAIFKHYLYILDDEVTLPIDQVSDPTHERFDFIVLRLLLNTVAGVDQKPNTVRLAVRKGAENALNILTVNIEPTLTQNASQWEVPIARVKVLGEDSNNSPDVTYIEPQWVIDKRRFLVTKYSSAHFGEAKNLLRNSEFLAFSSPGTGAMPETWESSVVTGTVTPDRNAVTAPLYPPQARSSGVDLGVVGNAGIEQTVNATSQVYTVRGWLHGASSAVEEGQIILTGIREGGIEDPRVCRQYYRYEIPYDDTELFEYQFTHKFENDDIQSVKLTILDRGFPNLMLIVYQQSLTPGYHSVLKPEHETIMFNTPLTDTSWDGDAKSTGDTVIDLATSFGGIIPEYGPQAVIARLRARDSGSAAATNIWLRAVGYATPHDMVYGTVYLEGVTNDTWREVWCVIPVDLPFQDAGNGSSKFRLTVAASGAGLLDADVDIVGIIT